MPGKSPFKAKGIKAKAELNAVIKIGFKRSNEPFTIAIRNATGVSINCCPITPHVLYREFKQAGLIEE